MILQTA